MRKLKRTKKVGFTLKNNKKYVAVACAGLIGLLGISQLSQVAYASESVVSQELVETTTSNMTLEEEINVLKEEFQQEYGTEDEFKVVYEDDFTKEEINGATGEHRFTTKSTGEVWEWNYFKSLDEELLLSNMTSEEKINYLKEEFQKEYGTEDEFKVVGEDEFTKQQINGATGEHRVTDKLTGEVDEWNYFEGLEQEYGTAK